MGRGNEKSTNATLPLLEFQQVERLAESVDYSAAAFCRMLIRWALPRWHDAWDALGHEAKRSEGAGTPTEQTNGVSQRFIARGPLVADGTKMQLMQVVQDQDGRWRTETHWDPVPIAEIDAKIEEALSDPEISGLWTKELPRLF